LLTFGSIQTNTRAILFVGTAVAGLGFGPAFMGAYRASVALAAPDDRAGVMTAIDIVSCLGSAVPAVIGGVATSHYGLHTTAGVYSLVVATFAAAAAGAILLIRRTETAREVERYARHLEPPPGPCTVPPCPPR
jgi:predicted MFS family arabinose efflux permease